MATARIEPVQVLDLLRDPTVRADPYPTYEHLRSLGALVPTSFGGYIVGNHAEAFGVLRDARFSSSQRHQAGYGQMQQLAEMLGFGDLFGLLERLLLFADPPDHTRLRRIVGKAFTPRAVEAMRPNIAATVDRLLDDMAERADADGVDVVESLAFPLPVTVISEMLGVPATDHERLRSLTAVAVRALDPSDDASVLVPAGDALREMRTYFDDLVRERRASPRDDLLSALIAAEDEGDRLTHDELLDTTILLFGAGHETTVNLIAGGALNLLTHRDELARLRDEPSLIASATEELLRYSPPVQMTARRATTDVELAGERLSKGSEVMVLLAAANRDPDVFDEPRRLDIGRADNRHLSFGGGIHLCLGAPLARIEGQEAIGRLVRRFPSLDLAVDEADVEWKPTTTIRGPQRLPLAW